MFGGSYSAGCRAEIIRAGGASRSSICFGGDWEGGAGIGVDDSLKGTGCVAGSGGRLVAWVISVQMVSRRVEKSRSERISNWAGLACGHLQSALNLRPPGGTPARL